MNKKEITIENEPSEEFESCLECKHFEDSVEICALRRCIHAITALRECYEPRKKEQEPFINKPCVSEKQCEHDKNVVLDKISAEIIEKYWDCDICKYNGHVNIRGDINDILQIIDKYKAEIEPQEILN